MSNQSEKKNQGIFLKEVKPIHIEMITRNQPLNKEGTIQRKGNRKSLQGPTEKQAKKSIWSQSGAKSPCKFSDLSQLRLEESTEFSI